MSLYVLKTRTRIRTSMARSEEKGSQGSDELDEGPSSSQDTLIRLATVRTIEKAQRYR